MGNFGLEPGWYIELRAQNVGDARAEAEDIWQRQPCRETMTGYAIWRADWGCVHSFRIDRDERPER